MAIKVLAIYREPQNSPNRESDDALILRAVVEELGLRGAAPELATPEAVDFQALAGWDVLIPMCESYARLCALEKLANSSAVRIINPPSAVLSCYRTRMVSAFASVPSVNFPPTEVRPVSPPGPLAPPAFDFSSGLWVKRGDVHNTCSHDVVFARDWRDVDAVRKDFARREISHMLLQEHVDGDLIKFYGVGPGPWFTWFYHDPESARRLPFESAELSRLGRLAASALGLEIFGGDAIVTPQGAIVVIDVNSWPSFARVRAEAAAQIARHICVPTPRPASSHGN